MKPYQESGICLDLTNKPHFRFQDLPGYQKLKGRHLKEMDFCWKDGEELILLEVKNYDDEVALAKELKTTAKDFMDSLIKDKLVPKIVDSLMMFAACWIPTNRGQSLVAEIPKEFRCYPKK